MKTYFLINIKPVDSPIKKESNIANLYEKKIEKKILLIIFVKAANPPAMVNLIICLKFKLLNNFISAIN